MAKVKKKTTAKKATAKKTTKKKATKKKTSSKAKKTTPKPNRLPRGLKVVEAFSRCDLKNFKFKTTKEIKPTDDIISQKRAVRAIKMGLGIRKPGYNIYVAGIGGTGKTSVIKSFLKKWSKDALCPSDWIYVHNFASPDAPKPIEMKNGTAHKFSKRIDQMIKMLREEIPAALQGEEYENTVNAFISESNDHKAQMYSDLEKKAKTMGFQIKSTRVGIETIPIIEGRTISEKEYNKLSDAERRKLEKSRSKLEPHVLDFARKVRVIELETKTFVEELQNEIGRQVCDAIIGPVKEDYPENEEIVEYLEQVQEYILENVLEFVDIEEHLAAEEGVFVHQESGDRFRKLRVNVFVDNRKEQMAPVVIETNPTYYNLFGKVEKSVENGMYLTDFMMVQAGAVHRANGGYLVLEAQDFFNNPSVWDTLKRVLRNRKGFIEDMGEQFSMLPTSGIRPEPIPLDIKVILIGSDEIYHFLHELDEDFSKIFKIKSDFDYKMKRNRENINSYISFVATRSEREDLLPFDKGSIGRIVEHGSRLVESQKELSTQFGALKDITIEADFIARENNRRYVTRKDVEEAIRQKKYRVSLVEEQMQEQIISKDVLIDIDGMKVGQINGLAVYDLGDHTFGKVSRITCTYSVNDEGIMNIERASKLSGNIHDKGIFIMSGFLGSLLAQEESFGFSASVCFEQSYGMIDGDSASIAELIAIVSAVGEIPIRQNFAVTGSLNQFGEVQPIGGVNEKVEGFFQTARDVGRMRKGDVYTVVIPHQNVDNLMLGEQEQKDIAAGLMEVVPVKYFWEAFEIATGLPFGIKDVEKKKDKFVPGSALDIIQNKLNELHAEEKSDEVSGRSEQSKQQKKAAKTIRYK